ncbi:16S rRNA (adenine(1518)-N(6)/adenine(1519)-N(6))-dimethyltransferase RsmA [Alkalilimnicola ehrlichii]|uniref:16S rRNA (adenine(1518)-N(6)/adenine(1519)-N(6))- dimethyltransferase RsmA n=1 Tax=Alkalilimnicola ehrlichii TaxID=351052 RepID=UPI003BA35C28
MNNHRRHRPRKRFGQNFLHDPTLISRMVKAIRPRPGDPLVEIGPGEGALTLPLLRAAGRLTAVELDRDLVAPLQARARAVGELTVHQADALRFDFRQLAPAPPARLRVVGNLPYNISTPLLFHLLESADVIQDMHFTLQKEVVERLAAPPGSKTYGRLSVMVQYRCAVTNLFRLPPGAFRPPPKVDSAFVRLVPHAEPTVDVGDEQAFARLVTQAFSQRRKTLRNTLRPLMSADTIIGVGIDPRERAENLSLEQFAALSQAHTRTKRNASRDTP